MTLSEVSGEISCVTTIERKVELVARARGLLAEAMDIHEVKEVHDQAKAMRVYYRQRQESQEAHLCAGELQVWADRRIGQGQRALWAILAIWADARPG